MRVDVLSSQYAEQVYAGVLGKVIGVYLGRPFEGWSYEQIQSRLGDIENYVHDELGVPLLVTDDDISGTFTFARALADNNFDKNISAKQIGQAWLNYLIEDRTILWWGGMGNSTEHTAYLRLKQGIDAPLSGSEALNGKVVAEQIGAQIFIDGWAMVSPGDPDQAAHFAQQAARVSHDGEAVNGAVVLAVMEAQAFVERDTHKLLDLALTYISPDSVIRRLIDDVRDWHAQESNWRTTREFLAAKYGYDKYGGNCHMVPNHGLIVHGLLHGDDDFARTMKIINTSGWDTDCNSGNLGCLMGIKLGLEGIDRSPSSNVDWRGPLADRIYIPTADPSWGISDCVRETQTLVNAARSLQRMPSWQPKAGAQFHFDLPGSTQGFTVTHGEGTLSHTQLKTQINTQANDASQPSGEHALLLQGQAGSRFGTPVFAPSKEVAKFFERGGYALMASPRVYPGQVLNAQISAVNVRIRLYCLYYADNDVPAQYCGEWVALSGADVSDPDTIELVIDEGVHPIFEVGIELQGSGQALLHALSWSGCPKVDLRRPMLENKAEKSNKATMWRRAWVNGADEFLSWVESHRVIQNIGRGMLIQGNRDWYDYQVEADITPHLAKAAGIAARVQGMRRYYALLLSPQNQIRLVCMLNDEVELAVVEYDWRYGDTYQMRLCLNGGEIQGYVDGRMVLEAHDSQLECGAVALVVEEGRLGNHCVSIMP